MVGQPVLHQEFVDVSLVLPVHGPAELLLLQTKLFLLLYLLQLLELLFVKLRVPLRQSPSFPFFLTVFFRILLLFFGTFGVVWVNVHGQDYSAVDDFDLRPSSRINFGELLVNFFF